MNNWIETLEKYYEDIPADLKSEVRVFLDEYYEKKNTHSATSLDGLSDEELGELLYLDLKSEESIVLPNKILKCRKLKILVISHHKNSKKLKILGTGEIKDKINIEADLASKSAIEKLEKISGSIQLKK